MPPLKDGVMLGTALRAGWQPRKGVDVGGPSWKPRTPADIGRDIAAAEQRIRDLKAELADVPPQRLEIQSAARAIKLSLVAYDARSGPTLTYGRVDTLGLSSVFALEAVDKLRDWLNYYYPKEA